MQKFSAIEQMYYGIRGSSELIKLSNERIKLHEVFLDKYKRFCKELNGNDKMLNHLKEMLDASDSMWESGVREVYVEGFRFGALMGLEIGNRESCKISFASCACERFFLHAILLIVLQILTYYNYSFFNPRR